MKNLFSLAFLLLFSRSMFGQGCIGVDQFPTTTAIGPNTIGQTVEITPSTGSCNFSGEYSDFSAQVGAYQLISSNPTDFFSITTTTGSTILLSGTTPLAFSVNSPGTLRYHIYSSNQCVTDQICRGVSLKKTGSGTPSNCIATENYPTSVATGPSSAGQTVVITEPTTACNFAGEYSDFTVSPGDYTISSTNNTDYFTLTTANSNNSVLFTGSTPLSFTVQTGGTYRYHIFKNSQCAIENICRGVSLIKTGGGSSTQTPSVTTSAISSISQNSASGGGNVTSDGGLAVTARGVCWSTSQNPTISNSKTIDGNGTGSFLSNITGLSPNTTYYVRAYGSNSLGTGYGNEVNFTTSASPGSLPVVSTTSPTSITNSSAISGGNVTQSTGSSVTARGVCWSISQNPTISNSKTIDGNGTGSFTSNITGLSLNTTYYVRAYATNSLGTGYGNEVTFTTEGCSTDSQVFLQNIGFLDESVAASLGAQYFAIYDLPPSMQYNPANPLNLQDLGKPIRFKVKCRNEKNNQLPITSGSCVIRTSDPNITITDSAAGLNNVLFNESSWSSNEFEIVISPNVTSSYTAKIDFIVKEGANQYISRCIPIPIRPFSTFTGVSNINGEDFYLVRDVPPGETDCNGNGNQKCDPNEQIETRPAINNLSEYEASYVTGFFRNLDNFSGINILTNQTGLNGSEINAQCWYNYVNNSPASIPAVTAGDNALHKSGKIDFVFKYNYSSTYAFDLYLIMTGGFKIFGTNSTPILMNSSTKIAYNQGSPLAPDYPVGIKPENVRRPGIAVYPNPTSGLINLVSEKSLNCMGYMIVNTLGATVAQGKITADKMPISLENLQPGIYSIRVDGQEAGTGVRIIKQ